MAGETISSSAAGTIYAKVIELAVIAYQYDQLTITPYFRQASIVGMPTTTAAFPRLVKSAGPASVATEATSITPIELTTTATDIAVTRIGIARKVSSTVIEDSVVARALGVAGLVVDAARLYGEFFDTTATALFASITATVGATGTTLSLPTMVALIGSQRTNKARGPLIISMHDNQLKQLQQAQVATTGLPWQQFFEAKGDGGQFGGYFMGAPIWASGLNPTSTGDRLGACWVDGQSPQMEFCGLGFVIKRLPSSLQLPDILMDSMIWASFARTGHGLVADNFCTSLRSVNA